MGKIREQHRLLHTQQQTYLLTPTNLLGAIKYIHQEMTVMKTTFAGVHTAVSQIEPRHPANSAP